MQQIRIQRGKQSWFAVLLVLCVTLVSFPAISQAAQSSDSPFGSNEFNSPRFGTHIEWTGDWAIDRTQSTIEQRREILVLVSNSANSVAFIELHSQRSFRTAESLLGTFLERFSGDESFEIDDDQRTAYPPTMDFAFESDGIMFNAFVQAEAIEGAWLVIAVLGTTNDIDTGIEAIANDITVNGRSILNALPICDADGAAVSATPTPNKSKGSSFGSNDVRNDGCITLAQTSNEPRPTPTPRSTTKSGSINDVTYRSQTFGPSLHYDSTVWGSDQELAAADNNGRDSLTLTNGALPATVVVEIYAGHNGKAGVCIDLALREWGITPGTDDPILDKDDNPIKGTERGRVWGAYLFDYQGTDLAGYVECRALPGASGVMVITLITNESSFSQAYVDLQPILKSINLNG